ncbi:MAG: metallophosphoesterase, partial [Acidilobaceae archaeon]
MMKILAVSDIHSPLYLALFRQALDRVKNEDLCAFVLAGDIIDRGKVDMAIPVVKEIRRIWREAPIIAVFGNEEYIDSRHLLIKNLNDVIWLDDSYVTLKCYEKKIGVVGTQGALDRLTKWQTKNFPQLSEIYMKRSSFIENTVRTLRSIVDRVIVVSWFLDRPM